MARIRGHAVLREDKPLFVLKARLDAAGRTFVKGDPFPWQELEGITPRMLRLLWEQRKIGHERPTDAAQGAEDPERAASEQARADARDERRKPARAIPKPAGARGLA